MKIVNDAHHRVEAYVFHKQHGKGESIYINPGELGEISSFELDDGRKIPILGDIICRHEGPDNNGVFIVPIKLIINEELSVKIEYS